LQKLLAAKACEFGADAVLVTREYNGSSMTGIALKFRDAPPAVDAK